MLNDSAFLQTIDPRLARPILEGFTSSISLVFLVAACVIAVGFVLVLFVRELPLRTMSGARAAAMEEAAPHGRGPAAGRSGSPPEAVLAHGRRRCGWAARGAGTAAAPHAPQPDGCHHPARRRHPATRRRGHPSSRRRPHRPDRRTDPGGIRLVLPPAARRPERSTRSGGGLPVAASRLEDDADGWFATAAAEPWSTGRVCGPTGGAAARGDRRRPGRTPGGPHDHRRRGPVRGRAPRSGHLPRRSRRRAPTSRTRRWWWSGPTRSPGTTSRSRARPGCTGWSGTAGSRSSTPPSR